jgi:hypothetical protein
MMVREQGSGMKEGVVNNEEGDWNVLRKGSGQ